MCEIFNRRMVKLEGALKDAALNLFEHMGSANACRIEIPNTSPQVFIIVGDVRAIAQLLKQSPKVPA